MVFVATVILLLILVVVEVTFELVKKNNSLLLKNKQLVQISDKVKGSRKTLLETSPGDT